MEGHDRKKSTYFVVNTSLKSTYGEPTMYSKMHRPRIKGVRGEEAAVAEEKKAEEENKENETKNENKNPQYARAQCLLGVSENYSYPTK